MMAPLQNGDFRCIRPGNRWTQRRDTARTGGVTHDRTELAQTVVKKVTVTAATIRPEISIPVTKYVPRHTLQSIKVKLKVCVRVIQCFHVKWTAEYTLYFKFNFKHVQCTPSAFQMASGFYTSLPGPLKSLKGVLFIFDSATRSDSEPWI